MMAGNGGIVAIALLRNEADIVEAFVRHTLRFADRLVVIDHRSIDGTSEVLRLLKDEGLSIDVRRFEGIAHQQSEVLSELIRELALTAVPDWIVALDADEFLIAGDRKDVRSTIASLPSDAVAKVAFRNYVPTGEGDGERNVLKRIRSRTSDQNYKKIKAIAIPRSLQGAGARLIQGNHWYELNGEPTPLYPTDELALAHFPVRTPRQLQAKALYWIANVMRASARPGEARHWELMFWELVSGKLESWDAVRKWAGWYAELLFAGSSAALVDDPVDAPFTLRYNELAECVAPRKLLEQLAGDAGVSFGPDTDFSDLAVAAKRAAQRAVAEAGTGSR